MIRPKVPFRKGKPPEEPPEMQGNLRTIGWTVIVIFGVLGFALVPMITIAFVQGPTCTAVPQIQDAALPRDTRLGCLEFWLNRYQTLFTGLLAILGAGWTVRAVQRQIESARRLNRQNLEWELTTDFERDMAVIARFSKEVAGKIFELNSALSAKDMTKLNKQWCSELHEFRLPPAGIPEYEWALEWSARTLAKEVEKARELQALRPQDPYNADTNRKLTERANEITRNVGHAQRERERQFREKKVVLSNI